MDPLSNNINMVPTQFDNSQSNPQYYYQNFQETSPDGQTYSPVVYDYSQMQFNDYQAQQMEDWKKEQIAEEEDEEDIRSKKDKFEYKVKSKVKNQSCAVFGLLLIDAGVLALGALFLLNVSIGSGVGVYLGVAFFKTLIASYQGTTTSLLANIKKDEQANTYVDKMRQKRPKPRYGIQCYHWDRYRDNKGRSKRRKVVSFSLHKQFKYKYWADWSPEVYKALDKHKLSALIVLKDLLFFDSKTRKHYDKLYDKFRNKYKGRDTHHTMLSNLHINKFEAYTLCARKLTDLPCYFGRSWFWAFNMLSLGWVYFYLFWSNVATIDYKLTKVVSNLAPIKLGETDGGDGDNHSSSKSDSVCSGMGLGVGNDTTWHKRQRDDCSDKSSKGGSDASD